MEEHNGFFIDLINPPCLLWFWFWFGTQNSFYAAHHHSSTAVYRFGDILNLIGAPPLLFTLLF
jgi:hypothetical protein